MDPKKHFLPASCRSYFDTESGNDFVSVYDGPSSDALRLAHSSGPALPSDVFSQLGGPSTSPPLLLPLVHVPILPSLLVLARACPASVPREAPRTSGWVSASLCLVGARVFV